MPASHSGRPLLSSPWHSKKGCQDLLPQRQRCKNAKLHSRRRVSRPSSVFKPVKVIRILLTILMAPCATHDTHPPVWASFPLHLDFCTHSRAQRSCGTWPYQICTFLFNESLYILPCGASHVGPVRICRNFSSS